MIRLMKFTTRRNILFAFLILLPVTLAGCTDFKGWLYEGFNRDKWQQPEQVIQTLNLEPGDRVADLGSGSGYFTFRLADAVGLAGRVYAVDIDAAMNADLAERVQEQGYQNIEVILATPGDPGLSENSIDLIFSSNTYHHLENRAAYFANLRQYLRPEGRIAIIDFSEESWLGHLIGHYTSSKVIQRELQEAGYTLEQELDFLSEQAFLIFSKE